MHGGCLCLSDSFEFLSTARLSPAAHAVLQCSQMVEPLSMVPLIRAKCRQAMLCSMLGTAWALHPPHSSPGVDCGGALLAAGCLLSCCLQLALHARQRRLLPWALAWQVPGGSGRPPAAAPGDRIPSPGP